MNRKLPLFIVLTWAISGHAEIILNDPLMELALRGKKMERVVHDLSVINSQLKSLKSKVDKLMAGIKANDTRFLHQLILPEILTSLEPNDA
jgi:hypothetical protein